MAEGKSYGRRQRNEFQWFWEDDDGVEQERTFHAKRNLSFEELVEYDTQRIITATVVSQDIKVTTKKLAELGAVDEDNFDSEAVGSWLKGRADGQNDQWTENVDNLLLLVVTGERQFLRPLLLDGDPRDVAELRTDLEALVLGRLQQEVQAVAGVDPTLPPPPSDSPQAEDSGPSSDSTE